ncbi:DUF3488 and DUF4129 domain-containing transglutaminase family protein [Streptomyces sp. TR06-5]|uniref:transglutaminase TgpA family protein n=1 Tax=Streptomyces sp. TR06-5 TaxID=3385976 RepID=UPI0039A1D5CE
MTGRGRLAWCAAVATGASACALLPLVATLSWLVPAALIVGAQVLVGIGARRVPLARALTVLAQVAVAVVLLTLLFARSEAVFGLLPGPDAFARFGHLFAEGGTDVQRFSIPAPVTDGIRLILLTGVAGTALLVDVVAVTYRSAAAAGLPLLALYSVAAGLYNGAAGWLWFLCAAGGFLLLLLAEGRERLSQWGRIFGNHRRPGAQYHDPGSVEGTPRAPVRTGRRIGATALGVALLVPAALPALDGGLLDSLGGTGGGLDAPNGTITAVDPLVALQDSLNQPQNQTVLVYQTDSRDISDLYLRIVALDEFDGEAWQASERPALLKPADGFPRPQGLSPDVETEQITTKVTAADWYAQKRLPLPYPARDVEVDGTWRLEPYSLSLVGAKGQDARGASYTVKSLLVRPTAQQLARAGAPPAAMERYTRVPDSLPDVVGRQARRVTRGAENSYEQAVRLQEWFASAGGFTYDTEVEAGSGTTAIAGFLEDKEGFCVHFAFTMAAMARTLGIPARVSVGFTPGQQLTDGRVEVGLQDAHAWPELYFEGVGWTRFEPTPTRGSAPVYALPDSAPGSDEEGGAMDPARPNTGEDPAPQPSGSPQCSPAERRLDATCGKIAAGTGGGGDGGIPWGTVLPVSGGVLLALLPPLLPMLWRTRVRARRLSGGAGVLSAWQELLDSAWDLGIVPDEAATPRRTAERLVEEGHLGAESTAAVRRVAHAVERHLYAPGAPGSDGVSGDVRRVRAELTGHASRRRRVRARWWPRSAVRLVRAAAEYRWALGARLRAASPLRSARQPGRP